MYAHHTLGTFSGHFILNYMKILMQQFMKDVSTSRKFFLFLNFDAVWQELNSRKIFRPAFDNCQCFFSSFVKLVFIENQTVAKDEKVGFLIW